MDQATSSVVDFSSPVPSVNKPLKTKNLDLLTFLSIIYWFELKFLLAVEISWLLPLITFIVLSSWILGIEYGIQKLLSWISLCGNPGLRILWHVMHLAVSVLFFLLSIVESVESFLIASKFLKKYETLDVSKVKYLAVVIDSDEARDTPKVIELLQWLVNIGVEKVCLYDSEGVLKKYKEVITDIFNPNEENAKTDARKHLDLEFISFSDGKEAVAKAANYLFANHYATTIQKEKLNFTEPQMGDALAAVGSGGEEPDLLLIYGSTRCHFGFPAWRLRYTEMVHMGSLRSMRFGALVKAVYRFTTVQQNYGT